MKRNVWLILLMITTCLSCTSTMTVTSPDKVAPEIFHAPPPPKALEMWQEAKNLEQKKLYIEAINRYRQIAAQFEDNAIAPQSLMQVANILARLERWQDVLAYCSYITKTYPQWREIQNTRMLTMKANVILRNFFQVIQMRSITPDTPEKELYLGLAYSGIGKVKDSIKHLESFISLSLGQQKFDYFEAIKVSANTLTQKTLQSLMQTKLSGNLRSFLHCVIALKEINRGKEEEARKRLEFLHRSLNPNHPLQATVKKLLRKVKGTSYVETVEEPADIYALGLIIPLDGRYGEYGRKILRGVTLAVSEWNNGHPKDNIKLIVENTSGDPALALKAYKNMVHEYKVLAILGPLGKSSLNALLSQSDTGSLLMAAFSGDTVRTANMPFHLRVMPATSDIVETIARYAIQDLGFKNLAILFPEDSYGRKAKEYFESTSSQLGGNIISSTGYAPGTTDFKSVIKRLLPRAPSKKVSISVPFEAIFVPDEVKTVTLLAPQLLYYNIVGVPLLGTNLWENPKLGPLSNGYMDGSYYATPYFVQSEDPETIRFRSKFHAVYNTWPGYLEAQGYDTTRLILAIRESLMPGQITRRNMIEATKGFQFTGSITGISQIRPDGSIKRAYKIIAIRGSKPVQVYP